MADNFNISDQPPEAGPKSVEVPGDIADGTAGDLMTWDAAGVSSLIAIGAASEVLTSNGAGAEPTWQAAGGGSTTFIALTDTPGAYVADNIVSVNAGATALIFTTSISNAQHGMQGGGSLHAAATGLSSGFMASGDKSKLDGIEPLAEVNDVDSVFTRTGAVVAAASDYAASQVTNDSGVAGAFVDDALDTLAAASAPVDSVFTRTGAVVAAASDYDASQVDNDSNIAGAFVDDALNNLDNAAAQARRTTTFTIPTVYGDVSLDTTDIESDSAIVNHDVGVNPDNIILEVAGLYEIHYHFYMDSITVNNATALVQARVRVNDTTVIVGSEMIATDFDDNSIEGNDDQNGLGATFLYQATASDFVTLQAQYVQVSSNDPTPDIAAGSCIMTVKRLTQ